MSTIHEKFQVKAVMKKPREYGTLLPMSLPLLTALRDGNTELAEVEGLKLPQEVMEVVHHFMPGVYIRELRIPKGTVVIGHTHRHAHTNQMLKGRLMVQGVGEVTAPYLGTSGPGRKVAYALEDSVWMNVYATDCRDVMELDETLFERSEASQVNPAPTSLDILAYDDFPLMCAEIGWNPLDIRKVSETLYDQIPFPYGSYKCKRGVSAIEGYGMRATANIQPGEVIAPARLAGKRTPAGRYTNHSPEPNARFEPLPNGDLLLVATAAIEGCRGGRDGEEITIDYRQAVAANLQTGVTL